MLTLDSGAKTKHQLNPVLTARSKVTVLRAARHLDIQGLHQLISLNTVVCLSNRDLSQRDRWLTSSHQPHMEDNQGDMEARHSNRRLDMEASLWVTEALLLPARVVMAVVSRLPTLSGISPPPKPSGTASKATRANYHFVYRKRHLSHFTILLSRNHGMKGR